MVDNYYLSNYYKFRVKNPFYAHHFLNEYFIFLKNFYFNYIIQLLTPQCSLEQEDVFQEFCYSVLYIIKKVHFSKIKDTSNVLFFAIRNFKERIINE